jgi:hypothetical protein
MVDALIHGHRQMESRGEFGHERRQSHIVGRFRRTLEGIQTQEPDASEEEESSTERRDPVRESRLVQQFYEEGGAFYRETR